MTTILRTRARGEVLYVEVPCETYAAVTRILRHECEQHEGREAVRVYANGDAVSLFADRSVAHERAWNPAAWLGLIALVLELPECKQEYC